MWPIEARVMVDLFVEFGTDIGIPVFPLAWFEDGHSDVVSAADGRVFLLHEAGEFLIGATPDEAIIQLVRAEPFILVDDHGEAVKPANPTGGGTGRARLRGLRRPPGACRGMVSGRSGAGRWRPGPAERLVDHLPRPTHPHDRDLGVVAELLSHPLGAAPATEPANSCGDRLPYLPDAGLVGPLQC
jgi:hypothetical protein